MLRFPQNTFPVMLLLILLITACTNPSPAIKLHYLGHSAYYLDFEGNISVLCDYGQENAYLQWGWDSPIYDAGEPAPDIITYSHFHDDHYDKKRAEKYDAIRISGEVDTVIGDLKIKSFESSEKDISKYDNYSYLFTYKGMRVLHLGDCQADIMMINDPAHAWNIENRYPKGCDIVIMPIESTQKFILQAVKMTELLEPKVLLPSHYWSNEYKQEFLEKIKSVYNEKNKILVIEGMNGSEFIYTGRNPEAGLLIPDLTATARIKQ